MIDVGRKILLIDETLDTALYIALRDEGHEVVACESPSGAWNLVYPFQPHLIVIHLANPSRNDIAILQECRAMAKGVPIIVATSDPKPEGIRKTLEDRVASVLPLPVKPREVRKLLDDLEPPANEPNRDARYEARARQRFESCALHPCADNERNSRGRAP